MIQKLFSVRYDLSVVVVVVAVVVGVRYDLSVVVVVGVGVVGRGRESGREGERGKAGWQVGR